MNIFFPRELSRRKKNSRTKSVESHMALTSFGLAEIVVLAFIFMHPVVEKELCGMEEWQLGGALWMVSTTDSTPRHDGQLTAIDDTIHYGNLWCCAGCEPQNATCTRGQVRFSITIARKVLSYVTLWKM